VFVGDLVPTVTDDDLRERFSGCGEIVNVNVIRERSTGLCKGYGFIHFGTREAQQKALSPEYNNSIIKGRPCRVKSADAKLTLFVGNVPIEMGEIQVHESLRGLLAVLNTDFRVELKTGPPPARKSRGFCFVTFPTHEVAEAAKKILMQSQIQGRSLNISWAENINREIDESIMEKVTTLYVSNIATTVSDEMLRSLFMQFGEVVKSVIVKNVYTGEPRGFAFVQFKERDNCLNALKHMNDVDFAGQKLAVVLAKPPPPNKTANTRQMRGHMQQGMNMGRGGYNNAYPSQPQSNYPQTRYQPYGPASASGGRPRGRGRPFRGATGAPATANQSYQAYSQQASAYPSMASTAAYTQAAQAYAGYQMPQTATAAYQQYQQAYDPNYAAQYYQQQQQAYQQQMGNNRFTY
jgi:RNA recognition motif-containing protein